MRARIRKAFTLVEILIVVVILGILAAIVVPQFTRATEEAQGGNIQAQLDTVNNQIELWRARHNGFLPGGSATSMQDYDWATMINNDGTDPNSGGYLKSPPKNPINGSSTVVDTFTAGAGWAWMSYPAGDPNAVYRLVACEYDNTAHKAMPGQAGQ
jgi:general secretion pathway protein G